MWSALLLLQELSACLSEFILAKPSAIRRYCCWSPVPCCLQQNYRKSTDHIFPSLPSYYPSPLLSVSLQGRLASQPPFSLFQVREVEKVKTAFLRFPGSEAPGFQAPFISKCTQIVFGCRKWGRPSYRWWPVSKAGRGSRPWWQLDSESQCLASSLWHESCCRGDGSSGGF